MRPRSRSPAHVIAQTKDSLRRLLSGRLPQGVVPTLQRKTATEGRLLHLELGKGWALASAGLAFYLALRAVEPRPKLFTNVMETLPTVLLKPGEADRIVAGHPWIYHGSVLRLT